jgi:hypothetical protein
VTDRLGRIVFKEVHPLDDGIAGQHDLLPLYRPEHGDIVAQAERCGIGGERSEILGDDVELAKALPLDALAIVSHRRCLA